MILPTSSPTRTPNKRERWFPGLAAGELLTAIAMTEPDTGSDSRRADDRRAALLDRAISALVGGDLDAVDAAMTKLFCTEMQGRVVDRCLQLFGGYGYVMDFPIARLYATRA